MNKIETRKIKIAKIRKLIFINFISYIAYLSWKLDHFWKWGGLHILSWENSLQFVNLNSKFKYCVVAPLNLPWPPKIWFCTRGPLNISWPPGGPLGPRLGTAELVEGFPFKTPGRKMPAVSEEWRRVIETPWWQEASSLERLFQITQSLLGQIFA